MIRAYRCCIFPCFAGASPTRASTSTRSCTSRPASRSREVSRANGGLDPARHAQGAARARRAARDSDRRADRRASARAGELYTERRRCRWATARRRPTSSSARSRRAPGLPERMCRANMKKNAFVLARDARTSSTSLTRGLDLDVLSSGYGEERGVPISYQAQSPVLGLVLPSNSPGVHTLWLPIIPLQIGLVLKPGPQEPWTPYRMAEAFFQAGIPREAISIYPGRGDVGAAVLDSCRPQPDLRRHSRPSIATAATRACRRTVPASRRSCSATIRSTTGSSYLDVMVDSVFLNSGRGCINCSGIWASRHTREIADAIAQRLAAVRPLPPDHPDASLAAFTVPGAADAISQAIDADLQAPGVTDVTATSSRRRRGWSRRAAPTTCCRRSCTASRRTPRSRSKEYMFPFVTVVECPEAQMLEAIGPTLVCTRDHRQRGVPARAARRGAHRPPESRPGADDSAELAAAARRQHRRVPVPRAGVSDRRTLTRRREAAMKILSITAGAAGMYCGSCFRDNALAAELLARGHDVTLLPLYTPTNPTSRTSAAAACCSAASASTCSSTRAVPEDAAVSRSLWDSPARHQRVREPIDLDRSEAARRSDDLDARRRPRRAAQGVRQAARVARRRAAARRRQPAELAADRPGGAAAKRAAAGRSAARCRARSCFSTA